MSSAHSTRVVQRIRAALPTREALQILEVLPIRVAPQIREVGLIQEDRLIHGVREALPGPVPADVSCLLRADRYRKDDQ